jgi:hypothetical protein
MNSSMKRFKTALQYHLLRDIIAELGFISVFYGKRLNCGGETRQKNKNMEKRHPCVRMS